ncbi:AMP-dependent synthetase/ligase [Catellatospora citrea]|uniref:Acyl-CoA synthetase n=1 Tax=Catellatospora citrea TaxID=53366 RepID=A0A8J3KH63_9ACTN|nr:long-chain fatty acid--CoA ligase [Catellatospora citrea]RKE10617.1 long-subunit acyl-CoA synthetase (AMP-forming) [Catellatospora citrea]GIG02903.1 fatty-acid--CoA ligase [Catellatospora citrea]
MPTFPYRTLCESFQATAALDPDGVALDAYGTDTVLTWREYADAVRWTAAGLVALGVGRGTTVALMVTNRPEFHIADAAAIHVGAVPFSIYNTSTPAQIAHLLTSAQARVVICEEQYADQIRASGAPIDHLVCVDARRTDMIAFDDLGAFGDPAFDFEAAWRAVQPDDLLTLIYTSGTTGPPKGVELTHANLLAEAESFAAMFDFDRTDHGLSYLPSAHIADRVASHYLQMLYGSRLTCLADIRELAGALAKVRPTYLAAVPRVFEKMRTRMHEALAYAPAPRRMMFNLALRLARRRGAGPVYRVVARLADRLVLAKVRRQLGLDRMRWVICGAAAISVPVLEFFLDLGLPVCEAWGMSETCGPVVFNPPAAIRPGTVGIAAPGVEVRLADDGELLVRGPVVTRGYHRDPAHTAAAFDDSWLRTGDVATMDADGYLRIVDRKKELIINASGKNMSPTNIEGEVKAACPLLSSMVVVGDGRPYNVALLVLDPEAVAAHNARHGADSLPAAVASGIAAGNAALSRVEQIKRYKILDQVWAPGGEELTPTLKPRRAAILSKYAAEIDALYLR